MTSARRGPIRVLVHVPSRAEEFAVPLSGIQDIDIRAAGSPGEVRGLYDWPEVFFGHQLDPVHLLAMPSLRWAQWISAGVDTLLSNTALAATIASGRIRLSRAVGVFGPSMAEYVLTYCLCLTQDVPRVLAAQKDRHWERFERPLLRGRRMGVAGLGSIGREIARLATAVGLEVFGLTRSGSSPVPVARVYSPSRILEFVSTLDLLVLALPLTAETEGIVSGPVLEAMKPGSVLVNVGRGRLVDEDALVAGLRRGRPGHAVLDVFVHEPLPRESEMWGLPNLIVTPHLSGVTRPGDVVETFGRNLGLFRAGEPLVGEVDASLGY